MGFESMFCHLGSSLGVDCRFDRIIQDLWCFVNKPSSGTLFFLTPRRQARKAFAAWSEEKVSGNLWGRRLIIMGSEMVRVWNVPVSH